MVIVTITSDWGEGGYYLGALKGAILSLSQSVTVVEITNSIPSFDILQEAFILKSCYNHFPKGSIHLMSVMSEPTHDAPMVILYADYHYFIGINDGRFSHLFNNPPAICFEILRERSRFISTFSSLELFRNGVDIILNNSFENKTVVSDVKRETIAEVVYNDDGIVGKVLYIDSFGNAITNIEKRLFDSLQRGRTYTIYANGPYNKINKISKGYKDSLPGAAIALFNSLGLLEIAINQGNMSELEGMVPSSEVRIKFN